MSGYTDEEIMGLLKPAQAGILRSERVRRHGFSHARVYEWPAKFDGMVTDKARRSRESDPQIFASDCY